MSNEYVKLLLEKFIAGTLTESERREFITLLHSAEQQPALEEFVDGSFTDDSIRNTADEETLQLIYQQVMLAKEEREEERIPQIPVRKITIWKRMAVAASLLLLLAVGYWLWIKPPGQNNTLASEKERFKNDVLPGQEKAVLVLADGRQVALEGKQQQTVADKEGIVVNNNNGNISYSNTATATVWHTLKVPRKGEYAVVLADGSRVKLNAESSVHYPVAFTGSERRVEVTGEVYFEVAKDAHKPFIVAVKGMEIKVLGTHFNVNAYANEAVIKTTLAEGSIQLTTANGKQPVTLQPGQQATVGNDGQLAVSNVVNVTEELAWTTGYFSFTNAPIETIMRQVERWYDVDVEYETAVSQLFVAEIPRTVNAADFFRILEATGWVHFKINGKKVIVIK